MIQYQCILNGTYVDLSYKAKDGAKSDCFREPPKKASQALQIWCKSVQFKKQSLRA